MCTVSNCHGVFGSLTRFRFATVLKINLLPMADGMPRLSLNDLSPAKAGLVTSVIVSRHHRPAGNRPRLRVSGKPGLDFIPTVSEPLVGHFWMRTGVRHKLTFPTPA